MLCPRCGQALRPYDAPRLVLHGCLSCGGLFLDGDTSKKVVSAIDPNSLAASDAASRAATVPVDIARAAACPSCSNPMDRMRVDAAGVDLDVCRQHGVWFDRDELARVVKAVAQPQQAAPDNVAPVPQTGGALPPSAAAVPYVAGTPPPGPPLAQPYAAPSAPTAQPGQPTQPALGGPIDNPAARFFTPEAAATPPGMIPVNQPVPPALAGAQGAPMGGVPGAPSFGGAPGGMIPGAPMAGVPSVPGAPQQGGWGVGKTALAVGGGLAAVAGVAYVATQTDLGRGVVGSLFGGGNQPPQPQQPSTDFFGGMAGGYGSGAQPPAGGGYFGGNQPPSDQSFGAVGDVLSKLIE